MANPYFIPVANQTGQAIGNLTQTIQGAGQVLEQRRQAEEKKRLYDEAVKERDEGIRMLDKAMQEGDYDTIASLSLKYPQMSEAALKMLGAKNERTQKDAVNTLGRLYLNPENYEQILSERKNLVVGEGGDPVDTEQFIETFRNNPELARQMTEGYLALSDPNQYKELKSIVKPSGGITPYQQAELEIKREALDLRRLEAENKRLENEQKRESNDLKRQEMQQKIEKNQLEIEAKKKSGQDKITQTRQDAQDVITNSRDTLSLLRRIEDHPGFSDYIGAKGLSSAFGAFDEPVAGTDAAGVAGMIETLTSQNFLDQIQKMKGMGALSNAEGQKVSAAVTSLNPNMSEKDFRKSLDVIRQNMNRAIQKARKVQSKFGGQEVEQQNEQLSDEELISKYL